MRSGCVYAQPTSALRTGGTDGSGSRGDETWPTPRDKAAGEDLGPKGGRDLQTTATGWPSPCARDGDPKRGLTAPGSQAWANKVAAGAVGASGLLSDDLSSSAAAWPTPPAMGAGYTKDEDKREAQRTSTHKGHDGNELARRSEHWPSPRASEFNESTQSPEALAMGWQETLAGLARTWPTPNAHDSGTMRSDSAEAADRHYEPHDLQRAALTFPCSHPARDGGPMSAAVGSSLSIETLPDGSKCLRLGPTSRRRLNPTFVEWLMGWPPGWTAYAAVGTESWSCRARRLLSSCFAERE